MGVEKKFQTFAYLVLRNNTLVIFIWLAITVLFSFPFFYITLETNPENLWVPHSHTSYQQLQYFKQNFGAFFRTEQLLLTSVSFYYQTTNQKRNIFQKQYLYSLYFLEKIIDQKKILIGQQNISLNQLCYKPIQGEGCLKPGPLDIWRINISDIFVDPDIQYTALCIQSRNTNIRIPCSDKNGVPVLKQAVFGGTSCGPQKQNYTIPCEHCWIQSEALALNYLLNNDEYTRSVALIWEKQVLEESIKMYNKGGQQFIQYYKQTFPGEVSDQNLVQFPLFNNSFTLNMSSLDSSFLNTKIQFLSQRSIPDELANQTKQNYFIVIISYTLMFLYIGIAIGKFPRFKETGFGLALGGILIVITCFICSIGIVTMMGIGLTIISAQVIPFLILAIGVDNMFIIKNSIEKQSIQQTIEKRIAKGFKQVAPSIATAAICEILAFFIGSLTKMPALQSFCIQASIAIFCNFLFQITVFLVFLHYDFKRKKNNYYDCLVCIRGDQDEPQPRQLIKTFIQKYYVPLLDSWICFIMVVIVFVGLAGLAVMGLLKTPVGLNQQVSMEYQSDLFNYFTAYKKYVEVGPPAYVIFQNFNYTDQLDLVRIKNISDGLSSLETVQPPVYSWIGVFQNFINQDGPAWAQTCGTQQIKYLSLEMKLKKFLDVKIQSSCCQNYGICGEQFQNDIIFNDDGSIRTSRLRFQHKPVKKSEDYTRAYLQTNQAVDLLKNISITQKQQKNAFPYSVFYIYYDQYSFIRGVAVQNLLLALSIVFITTVLLTSVITSLLITSFVLLTTVNLISIIYLLNLIPDHGFIIEINAISVVNFVTCVGLSVQFCAHTIIRYMKSQGPKKTRVMKSMQVGGWVFVGIIITKFLGVMVLMFANSTIFRLYYFRMYLGIVVCGAFNGLVLLPSLLLKVGLDKQFKRKQSFQQSQIKEPLM